MPIPALKVKSPQNWKKTEVGSHTRRSGSQFNNKSISKRRKAALRKDKDAFKDAQKKSSGGKIISQNRSKNLKVSKRSTYFGERSERKNYKKQGKFKKKLIKFILWGILIIFLFSLGMFAYYSRLVPDKEDFLASLEGSSTKIYDRTGEHLLYDIYTDQKRTWIPIDQIPSHVKWALISIEDDQFYSHSGFDIPALIKVALHEVFGIGPQRGGSTITQQLVKNSLLTPERSYIRKMKELVISYHMEKKLSKDEILELYFNVVSYGSTAYGVESAAETYFGKKAEELSVAEGAILAAMLQATTYLSPYGSHVDELMERKELVLNNMLKLGYITQEEYDGAMTEELEFKRMSQDITAPHFVLYIKEMLAEKYGEEVVEKGGLKVITTLDYDKQIFASEAVAAGAERNMTNYGAYNASLVSVDTNTGDVLAMVGSKDYFADPEPEGCTPGLDCKFEGNFNVAMQGLRQPGSSFKPIVYASSFEQGLSPETMLYDVLTTFPSSVTADYEPHNYDDKTYGPVAIRQALAGSLNIPAVKAIYLAGVENVLDLAEKLGYTTFEDRSRFGLSLVLGGGEVKLIDHVRAFATLAENGRRKNLRYILKVEDSKGKVLEDYTEDEVKGEKVMDEEVAKQISSILSDDPARSYVFGSGSYLTLPGRPVAAKTGTTNDYRDGWTIGYTPSMATAVWVGNNDNSNMKGAAAGGNVAAPIWNEYMRKALEGTPVEQFEAPASYDLPDKPMLDGTVGQENKVRIDKISGKLATENTPEEFIEERAYGEMHSILHYVDKDDILGPIPSNPAADPQYNSWEEAIAKWAEENEIETKEEAPTEYDDVHTEENKPNLDIISPSSGQYFNNPLLNVNISVSTMRSLDRVEYYIDSQLISTQRVYPFHLNGFKLIGFENGERWLRVRAVDDVGNYREQSVKIYLDLAEEYRIPVEWLSPQNYNEIYQEQFPLNLQVKINNSELYKKVDFYAKKTDGDSAWVGYKEPAQENSTVLVEELQPGSYDLYVVLTDYQNNTLQDKGIRVEVLE